MMKGRLGAVPALSIFVISFAGLSTALLLVTACSTNDSSPADRKVMLSGEEVVANVQTLMKSISGGGTASCHQMVLSRGGWDNFAAEYLGDGTWSVTNQSGLNWTYFEKTGAVTSNHTSANFRRSNC